MIPNFRTSSSAHTRMAAARVEIGIATMACNLKRITKVLRAVKLTEALLHSK